VGPLVSVQVVYVAHPLGGDVDANAHRARRWLRWLMDLESEFAFCCPWLPFVDVGYPDEKRGPGAIDPDSIPEYRARCLRDDIVIAAKCDAIVLCGGRISPGMQQEANAVIGAGGWVADLTSLGVVPPSSWPPPSEFLNTGPITFGRCAWSER
jgi:hypothetical protein